MLIAALANTSGHPYVAPPMRTMQATFFKAGRLSSGAAHAVASRLDEFALIQSP